MEYRKSNGGDESEKKEQCRGSNAVKRGADGAKDWAGKACEDADGADANGAEGNGAVAMAPGSQGSFDQAKGTNDDTKTSPFCHPRLRRAAGLKRDAEEREETTANLDGADGDQHRSTSSMASPTSMSRKRLWRSRLPRECVCGETSIVFKRVDFFLL